MRQDSTAFAVLNQASSKEPRFVISIEYDVESVYLTSHAGIDAVPGIVIDNVLQEPSAISQKIVPDEGRSEIGTFNFSLIDLDSAFTDEIRDKLLFENKGIRGRTVRFYVGYRNPSGEESFGGFGAGPFGGSGFGSAVGSYTPPDAQFGDFQLFQTQIVKGALYSDGVYRIQCNDITRELRKDIFEPKRTTLTNTISATDTTVSVATTTGFDPVAHGTSWSDAPSSTVGYIKIGDEIIRYTAKTASTFTGCTRGVLNTKAVDHVVDPAAESERRPRVDEVIYLELPAVKLAYAIMTGVLWDSSNSIPSHWHLGIDPDLITDSDFTGIGTDLWDTTDDAAGFIVRFLELKKTDGKKFLESEIYQLIGCHQVIYADGTIGLKRMNQVLSDAAYVLTLDERNVVSAGDLEHDLDGMINSLQIDWNWNGEEFTRRTLFIDSQSVDAHGASKLKKLAFKGLHGSRHTDGVIRKRLDAFRDRYAEPPERITVEVLPSLNPIELGDIVRLQLPNVRDWAGNLSAIDRSFEVQRKSENFKTGNISLELFGSTARPSVEAPTGTGTALPDAFYDSAGTELSTVVTISVVGGVGVIQAGSYNLTGHANLNNASAIYYYEGDLELSSGATITVNDNVQIRVRGFFTINGDIDGIGRGKAGVADDSSPTSAVLGTPGFIGNSRGMDGVKWWRSIRGTPFKIETRTARTTFGLNSAFPFLELVVDGNDLVGLPNDLRGTSGGPGEKVIGTEDGTEGNGGTGADSGAGLAIISRGLAFGASGSINLSGDDSAATSLVDNARADRSYPGSGGAGTPGGLFIGIDGGSLSLPDVGGKIIGATGTVPIQGDPMNLRERHTPMEAGDTAPYAGFLDPAYISDVDLSNVFYRIQYIPAAETAQEDQNTKPPAPTGLTVTGQPGFNEVVVQVLSFLPFDTIQVYASIDNNRSNAVLVAEGRQTHFTYPVVGSSLRYHWARTKREMDVGPDVFSDFFPLSSSAGVTEGSVIALPEIAPDYEFGLKTDQTYWYLVANPVSGLATSPTIELTGGNVAGRAIIPVQTDVARAIIARRKPYVQAITGEAWTVKVRWRRTATITGSSFFYVGLFRHSQPPTNANFDIESGMSIFGGISLSVAELNARTVNAWQEDTGLLQVTQPSGYVAGSLPYLTVIAAVPTTMDGGNIEIDYLNAMPGSNGRPQERTYTAGTGLTVNDVLYKVIYDSASGGTLTLPNAITELVGTKIWFEQLGAGLLTIGDPSSGTLFSPPNTSGNRALSGRYAQAVAEAKGDLNWYLTGDLA